MAVAFGLLVKFVLPTPAGITPEAWTLFSVFLSTILGLVLQPLPVGAWAFLGLCVVVATKTLPFAKVGGEGRAPPAKREKLENWRSPLAVSRAKAATGGQDCMTVFYGC